MEKILIYAKNNNILIVANATNTDLLCEYIHIVYDIPYPKINFSYGIKNAENKIIAMTLYKNRFHFCKRFLTYPLAKRQYKQLTTYNFQFAMDTLDRLVKTATK